MKTIKWILLSAALLVLTVTAVSGTLGDEGADGKYLYIVQSELMRSDRGLVDAGDTRALLPAVYTELNGTETTLECNFAVSKTVGTTTPTTYSGTVALSTTEKMYRAQNALDHIVVVTNLGNVDGYVRTWFAFEMGELTEEEFKAAVALNRNTDEWTWEEIEYGKEINGQRYAVVCAEYKTALPFGGTTAPSLLQVMLCSGVSNETAGKLDGDKDGNYEIMVSSRIISDKTAWGAFTDYAFPAAVTTEDELQNAIDSGADEIILGDDIELGSGLIFG